jgi:hypothetical protein
MSGDMISGIRMHKGNHKIKFVTTVYTPKGVLQVVVLKRRQAGTRNQEMSKMMPTKVINYSKNKMV